MCSLLFCYDFSLFHPDIFYSSLHLYCVIDHYFPQSYSHISLQFTPLFQLLINTLSSLPVYLCSQFTLTLHFVRLFCFSFLAVCVYVMICFCNLIVCMTDLFCGPASFLYLKVIFYLVCLASVVGILGLLFSPSNLTPPKQFWFEGVNSKS